MAAATESTLFAAIVLTDLSIRLAKPASTLPGPHFYRFSNVLCRNPANGIRPQYCTIHLNDEILTDLIRITMKVRIHVLNNPI